MKFFCNVAKNVYDINVQIVTIHQYSLISVVTGLWAGRSGIRSPSITINTLLLLQSIQTNCLALPVVYPVGTLGFAHGVETA